MAPTKAAIVINAFAHQAENFTCRAEMDEFGGRQLEKFQTIGAKSRPNSFTSDGKFVTKFSFRCLSLKGFQRGIGGQRIEEIAIKGKANLVIDKLVVFRIIQLAICRNKTEKRLQHIGREENRTCVDINAIPCIDGTKGTQRLFALLVEETCNMAVVAFQKDAVVFTGRDVFFEGNGGGAIA